jgi:outer membrane protein OmpA-like peptidoglycan-associated protein
MIHLRLNKLVFCAIAFLLLSPPSPCVSQIRVDTSLSVHQLVKEVLLGDGVAVQNVRYNGPRHAIAHFRDSTKILSVGNGLLLTSGNAFTSLGPNQQAGASWGSRGGGYAKLDAIAGGDTHDAAVLEFDFVTSAEILTFNFIFASEEYPEYVGSKYNDVFAFFINGPGLPNVNLAMLPRSRTPVTVNSINHKTNRKFFVDNPTFTYNDRIVYDVRRKRTVRNKNYHKEGGLPRYNIQYDGFTTVLEATCKVIPGEVYHIEMAIADVGDYSLDSGIFLEAHSFRSMGGSYVSLRNTFEKAPAAPPITPSLPVVGQGNKITVPEEEPAPATPTTPVEKKAKPAFYQVLFAFDSFELSDTSLHVIEEVCRMLQNNHGAVVEVVGHTDCVGSDVYNDQLSQRRAAAVAGYLLERGISARVVTLYKGERIPVGSNETDFGRGLNRRTEIIIKGEFN